MLRGRTSAQIKLAIRWIVLSGRHSLLDYAGLLVQCNADCQWDGRSGELPEGCNGGAAVRRCELLAQPIARYLLMDVVSTTSDTS